MQAGDRPAEPLVLKGHERRINRVAIAPSGNKVVSASSDHTLKIWALKNGKDLLTLTGHTGPVTALAKAPDGRVISGSADGTLRIWDPVSGSSLATLRGHEDGVSAVLVTPEGRHAVSLSGEATCTFKVWDLARAGEGVSPATATGRISKCALSGDGRSVVYASDADIHLWDFESGATKILPAGHRGRITALAAIPGKRGLVSSSEDGTLLLWDLNRATPVAGYTCEASVNACAIAPDGSTAVAGGQSGTTTLPANRALGGRRSGLTRLGIQALGGRGGGGGGAQVSACPSLTRRAPAARPAAPGRAARPARRAG